MEMEREVLNSTGDGDDCTGSEFSPDISQDLEHENNMEDEEEEPGPLKKERESNIILKLQIPEEIDVANKEDIRGHIESVMSEINTPLEEAKKYRRAISNITPIDIPEELINFIDANPFEIDIWVSSAQSTFKNKYGVLLNRIGNHSAAFYYRTQPCEVFILTSGSAAIPLRNRCDPSFPTKMASRLVDFSSVLADRRTNFFGNIRRKGQIMREKEKFDFGDITALVTEFTVSVKRDCSVFNFPFFQNQKGEEISLKVQIRMSSLKFNIKLNPSEDMVLLNHFSKIWHGMPTYCFPNQSKVEADSTEIPAVTMVENGFTKELEGRLCVLIHNETFKPEKYPWIHFTLFRQGFTNAKLYKLTYGRKSVKKWGHSPSSSDLIRVLRGDRYGKLKDKKSEKSIREALNRFRLSYSCDGETFSKSQPLLNFVECNLFHSDSDSYWKISGRWYKLRKDCLVEIHRKFINLIKDDKFLIISDPTPHPDHLPLKWVNGYNEGDYNKMYADDPRFIVGDIVSKVNNIELFDLLKIENGQTVLYHVKQDIGQKTRDACSQIKNATKFISESMASNNNDLFCELFTKLDRIKLETLEIDSPEKLKSLFKSFKFIYGYTRKGESSLHDEKNKKTVISPADVKGFLEMETGPVLQSHISRGFGVQNDIDTLSDTVYKCLREENFIDERGHVTAKLIFSKSDDYKLSEKRKETKDLLRTDPKFFEQLLLPYRTGLDSMIAKMEILETRKALYDKYGVVLQVDEIETEARNSDSCGNGDSGSNKNSAPQEPKFLGNHTLPFPSASLLAVPSTSAQAQEEATPTKKAKPSPTKSPRCKKKLFKNSPKPSKNQKSLISNYGFKSEPRNSNNPDDPSTFDSST